MASATRTNHATVQDHQLNIENTSRHIAKPTSSSMRSNKRTKQNTEIHNQLIQQMTGSLTTSKPPSVSHPARSTSPKQMQSHYQQLKQHFDTASIRTGKNQKNSLKPSYSRIRPVPSQVGKYLQHWLPMHILDFHKLIRCTTKLVSAQEQHIRQEITACRTPK